MVSLIPYPDPVERMKVRQAERTGTENGQRLQRSSASRMNGMTVAWSATVSVKTTQLNRRPAALLTLKLSLTVIASNSKDSAQSQEN